MKIRHQVSIPFGGNEAAPLQVVSDAPGFMLQIRDTNGAPIITLGLDPKGYKVIRWDARDDTPAHLDV